MSESFRSGLIVGAFLFLVAVDPAGAAPTIGTVGYFTDRFAPNPLASLPDGNFAQITATVFTSDPLASLTVVATRGTSTVALPYFPYTAPILFGPMYTTFIPFTIGDPTEPWTITATDSTGTSVPVITDPIFNPQLIPFVTAVTVSDHSTTPLVSWSEPDLTGFDVDDVDIRIIDNISEFQVFQTTSFLGNTSFPVPAGILQPGRSYIYRISLRGP